MRVRVALLSSLAAVLLAVPVLGGFAGTDLFIPMAGRGAGAYPSNSFTTVYLYNPSATAVSVDLSFLERNKDNVATSPPKVTDTLAAGETRVYEDIVETTFGKAAYGAVRIQCAEKIVASARVFSKESEDAPLPQSFGQDFAATPASFAIGVNESTEILGGYSTLPYQDSAARFNLGCVETTGVGGVTVRWIARDAAGVEQKHYDRPVPRLSQTQGFFHQYFDGIDLANSRVSANVIAGSGKVICYGSWLSVSSATGSGTGSVTVPWTAKAGTPARNGTATIAGSSFSVSQAAASTTTLQNDWVPCGPPGGAAGGPGEDVGHPERMRVLMAHSTDGLHFQRSTSESARLLLDQADIPDAVVLPSGRILVYLIADCRDHTPFGGTKDKGLGVAISDAKGAPGTWIFKDVTTDWAAHGLGPPMDPNVVLWKPEENLLRLFLTQFPGGVATTYSYTSTDGFTFKYEGPRYNPGFILDPENFRFGDSNWQIITASPNGYAISTDDGSTFTNDGPFSNHVTSPSSYSGTPGDISVTRDPGVYRIFATANGTPTTMGNIESLRSTASPWTSWELEGTVLEELPGMESCGITCPTVVRLADDDWLMFYATINPNCVCGGLGPLFHCSPPTAAPTCSVFTISPTSASATAPAGSQSVTVTGWPSGCTGGSWTASGNGSWLSVSPSSGSGSSGSVTVSWTPNAGTSSRTGTITIAGQTFTVNQAAASCTYSINPTSASFSGGMGQGSVSVTATHSGCSWTATSSAPSWLTITSGTSGSGSGIVQYSVADNTSGARSAFLTIAGETFTVNQAENGTAVHRRLRPRGSSAP
jgi:hypothetical protein